VYQLEQQHDRRPARAGLPEPALELPLRHAGKFTV
jgi:hypothetical protein